MLPPVVTTIREPSIDDGPDAGAEVDPRFEGESLVNI